MSAHTATRNLATARPNWARLGIGAIIIIVIAAIAVDTKVVRIGSKEYVSHEAFSPAAFGAAEFPKIRANVIQRAVDAKTLATAVTADPAAAAKQYGVPAGIGSVIPVSFTGVVGDGKSGIYYVNVDGLPAGTKIRVQTGPAINGTDLRDVTGKIHFGDFRNQIEYQNAGAAINNEMKREVLASLKTNTLQGKTVHVVGAFTLINPKNWLVTPVEIKVQ